MLDLFRAFIGREEETSLMRAANDHLQGMLGEAEQLLRQIHPYLMRFDALVELREAATAADRRSDEHDREMRRALLGHLSVSRAATDQALGLLSVGSRAERVVDLVREIVEISAWVRTPLPQIYMAKLTAAFAELLDFLVDGRQCMATADAYRSLAMLDRSEKFRIRITQVIVDDILEDASLTARQAIILYRSFHIATRLAAQLSNIVAVVALPLEQVDFVSTDAVAHARRKLRQDGGDASASAEVPQTRSYTIEDE